MLIVAPSKPNGICTHCQATRIKVLWIYILFLRWNIFSVDDFPDVHPNILEQYHSVDIGQTHQECHQTGAGYPSDESDDKSVSSDTLTDLSSGSDHEEGENPETNELWCQIAADIHVNVHHKPVKTPWNQTPFKHPAQKAIFFAALNRIQMAQLIPLGFGLKTSEWEDGLL
ncbi:hypothetical protein K439DRAFT_1546019 [Ramaria rubella]|nr:hypothetical protein K439DRAFT_1546019 [Ramaria rubella]